MVLLNGRGRLAGETSGLHLGDLSARGKGDHLRVNEDAVGSRLDGPCHRVPPDRRGNVSARAGS